MKALLLGAGTAVALALTAPVASAAPYGPIGKAASNFEDNIVMVHGRHRECVRGRWGWHRSTHWGRTPCRPHWGWGRWNRDRRGHDDYQDYDDRGNGDRGGRRRNH